MLNPALWAPGRTPKDARGAGAADPGAIPADCASVPGLASMAGRYRPPPEPGRAGEGGNWSDTTRATGCKVRGSRDADENVKAAHRAPPGQPK